MSIRFQAFLAATVLVASGLVLVTATALADVDSLKTDRRVGDSQLVVTTQPNA
jgi:hypothetical protein